MSAHVAPDIVYRGLNVSRPDVTSAEELADFLGFTDQPTGRPMASYELWADLRPDVLKRLLAYVHQIHVSESFSCPLPYINLYAVAGWSEGVRYIMDICQPATFLSGPGYSRAAVVETLALSFYLSPTLGSVRTAQAVREGLAAYREPAPDAPSPFPAGWDVDPEPLRAGLDYSNPDLTKADLDALTEWYLQVCGEVPASVTTYARYRPTLLKAGRHRWENIVQTGLPTLMFAFLLIHHAVWSGNQADTRESLLLARGLGMTKEHAVDAVFYGGSFLGGMATIGAVSDTVEEIFDAW